jgi:iron complex transport system substrate-binding protein
MTGLPKILKTILVPAFITLASCGSPTSELPSEAIVSTTLCADGYLHALPEVEPRLAALSWQSRSALSRTPDHLKALPQADSDPERRLNWAGALEVSTSGGGGDIDVMGKLEEFGVDPSALAGLDADGIKAMIEEKGIDLSMLENLGVDLEEVIAKFKGEA